MTRESAKLNLKFIIAFANGEQIQYLSFYGEWQDFDDHTFTQKGRYRVKPNRVFVIFDERTKDIEYLSDNESTVINFNTPFGCYKSELVKFYK